MGAFLVQRNGGKQNERKKQMGTGTRAIYSKRPVQSFIKGNALVFLVYACSNISSNLSISVENNFFPVEVYESK